MRRSINMLAAAAAIAATASPALADDSRSVAFMVYTADFATPQARAALDRRIKSAVEDLCGVNAAAEGVSWGEIKKCQSKARQDIYGQMASIQATTSVQLSAR